MFTGRQPQSIKQNIIQISRLDTNVGMHNT